MANIATLITTVKTAQQGADVRDAIADTLTAVNVDNVAITSLLGGLNPTEIAAAAVTATTKAGIAVESAANAMDSEVAAAAAKTAAQLAETNAKTSETNSKASETASKASETAAAGSAATATTKANESAASAAAALASEQAAALRKSETQAIKDAAALALAETTDEAEVIEARKGKVSLGEKINEIDTQLAEKATKTALEVEKARINLIQVNPGSTSGDIALNDIKIDTKGKTHNSPGDAVRGQVSDLSSSIDKILISRENALSKLSPITNELYEHGKISTAANTTGKVQRYEPIFIQNGVTYYYKNLYAYFCTIKYADNSLQSVSNTTGENESGTFTATQNGYIYITACYNIVGVTDHLITTSEEMYNDAMFTNYYLLKESLDISNNPSIVDMKNIAVKNTNLLLGVNEIVDTLYGRGTINRNPNTEAVVKTYDPIKIISGKTYYYRNVWAYFCSVKYSDGTIVSLSNSTDVIQSGSFTATNNGFIYMSVTVAMPITQWLLTDSEDMYLRSNFDTYYSLAKKVEDGKTFYIGIGEKYTTLRSGMTEAIKYPKAIVHVKAGTYNLLEEFSTEITANPNYEFGIKLENDVHVIFESGALVTALYDGTISNITMRFAPFYAGNKGGFIIENLDLSTSNTRYSIHDENGDYLNPRVNKYLRCRINMDNTAAVLKDYPQCIGGGCGIHDYIYIDSCYFKTKWAESFAQPLVSYHNNGPQTEAQSNIFISNCYFADKGTFRCTHYGVSQQISRAHVNNNSLGSSPIIKYEIDGATTPQNFELISFLNEVRS